MIRENDPIDSPKPDDTPPQRKLKLRCHAKSKTTGHQCKHPAITGKKVCYHHGGAKGSGSALKKGDCIAFKHGLYSDLLTGEDIRLYKILRKQDATDPESIKEEIALLRVKIIRYLRNTEPNELNFDALESVMTTSFIQMVQGRRTQVNQIVKKPQGFKAFLDHMKELRQWLTLLNAMELERFNKDEDGTGDDEELSFGGLTLLTRSELGLE